LSSCSIIVILSNYFVILSNYFVTLSNYFVILCSFIVILCSFIVILQFYCHPERSEGYRGGLYPFPTLIFFDRFAPSE